MTDKYYAQLLGNRVKSLRKAQRLSQEQLAERIDKSVDTISSLERGKIYPRFETALQIAETLDVELYELFQVYDMPVDDKRKTKLIQQIIDLLQDQPEEILKYILEQARQIISLKEKFIEKLRK